MEANTRSIHDKARHPDSAADPQPEASAARAEVVQILASAVFQLIIERRVSTSCDLEHREDEEVIP